MKQIFLVAIALLATASALHAQTFTMEQTLSDEAQRTTIAFDGLAFLSGSLGADSFFPPGKVADYWGFQYLRDNDPTGMGHNTDFLTKASLNMLSVLTASQRQDLIALANRQVDPINQYAMERFVLMKAFRRLLEGDVPSGASGLDREAVKTESAKLYRLDGQISYERAQVMGGILAALTPAQRSYLDAMAGKGMLTWPTVEEPAELRGLSHDAKVAVMTYAGDLFSWYAGSVEADVYFCPERQGTYFGSFYMKDAPAVGNPNYSIDTNLTANGGRDFLATLTISQASAVTSLVDLQRTYLLQIVETRRTISTMLRRFIAGQTPDQTAVLELSETYGKLDGEIVYLYASAFAQTGRSLDASQKARLAGLRTKILGNFAPTGAYLYATPIGMPSIPNTDFLFGSTAAAADYAIVDTGQTACYGNSSAITCQQANAAFYGQDAQHSGALPAYTTSADGLTVSDGITGLTWQRNPDTNGDGTIATNDKLTWAQAKQHPAALNAVSFGGYSDWRLPSTKELYSLITFRGTDPSGFVGTDTSVLTPFIDTRYFQFAYGQTSAGERIIDSQYASSTVYVVNTSSGPKLFGVNFADGRIKGYDLTMPDRSEKTFFVQCVRGSTNYGVNQFVDNGDGTVTDAATARMWTKSDSGTAMTWESALAWAQARNAEKFLGHDDWRVPDAKELQSIVDYRRSPDTSGSAAIDPVFNCTAIRNESGSVDYPWYWTSTTHAGYSPFGSAGSYAVYIAFGRGTGWMKRDNDVFYTLTDVHGAGAQRSDPKSGDLTAYYLGTDAAGHTAYGHGPQGDAVRVSNFVRLVRDAEASGLPQASFTYAPSLPRRNQDVQFSDGSNNATSWQWSFGDGATSAERNPSHVYAASGSFTVTLVAKSASGSSTATQTITVQGRTRPVR